MRLQNYHYGLLAASSATGSLLPPNRRSSTSINCYPKDVTQCIDRYQARIASCEANNPISKPFVAARHDFSVLPDRHGEIYVQTRKLGDGCLCITYKDMMKCYDGCEGSDDHVAMARFVVMFCGA